MENLQELFLNTPGNTRFAKFNNIIMHKHFDLTCAKVEEVNKQFVGFDNMQALYLYIYKFHMYCTWNIFKKIVESFKIIVHAMDMVTHAA